MTSDQFIAECLTILRSTLESYKEKPTWSKLKAMFQRTLLLGIELGKKQVYINQEMIKRRKKKMINKVVLIGRITKDPDLRKTPTGVSVVKFTLAVNRKFAKDGEQQADFINCVAWRQSADYMSNYVKKGTLLEIEGRIETRNYKDQSDKTVYITEIICEHVGILASQKSQDAQNEKTNVNVYGTYESAVEENYGDVLEISADDLPF